MKCSRKHHTLLHININPRTNLVQNNTSPLNDNAPTEASSSNVSNSTNCLLSNTSQITDKSVNTLSGFNNCTLLETALVDIKDKFGNFRTVRAVLDGGSRTNLITSKCFKKLGLTSYSLSINICGVGQRNTRAAGYCECTIKPVGRCEPHIDLDFVVLPQICHNQPSQSLSREHFNKFSNLVLADPSFYKYSPIDILLGAEIVGFLLVGDSISTNYDEPVAQETLFGWVVTGKFKNAHYLSPSVDICLATHNLENFIKTFWALEEVPSTSKFSSEDLAAEELF
uniref:Uncharacterized protein n=1 Tax=Photinus pyralis TaxID=7054 RepID=A0A1Y1MR17_PHOPY